MNRLQLPHAKLFYMIGQMYKKGRINDDEKRILKEKAISDDLQIFQILEKYERTKNEEELMNNLVTLVKGQWSNLSLSEAGPKETEEATVPQSNHHETEPVQPIVQASSPWAEFLRKKKKDQSKQNALMDIKKNILEPHNAQNDQ